MKNLADDLIRADAVCRMMGHNYKWQRRRFLNRAGGFFWERRCLRCSEVIEVLKNGTLEKGKLPWQVIKQIFQESQTRQ